jgi:malonyl-CoA/methylmalonyl-CoA synthetase
VNEKGLAVASDTPGDLWVKGANVFSGYWNNPDKTAESFTEEGFFITGDIASIDPDGYISIVGRSKDLIISGGLNIYPKELELLLDKFEPVSESAVIGLPHPDFGEAVCAVIVLKPNALPDADEIQNYMRQQVANFKVPKAVFFTDQLPRNSMSKVQKNLLRDQHQDTFIAP